MVVKQGEQVPDSCTVMYNIKIGDNGYNMGCDYESILNFAKLKTQLDGGNVLKINTVKRPDHFCDCYRLYGTILYRKNLSKVYHDYIEDSIAKYKFGDTAKYAILYVFRPRASRGSLVGFNIHLGDSTICRAKNMSVYEIKLKKEGKIKLTAQTESSVVSQFEI